MYREFVSFFDKGIFSFLLGPIIGYFFLKLKLKIYICNFDKNNYFYNQTSK